MDIGGFIGALLLLFLLNTVGLSIYGSIWGTIAGLIISLFGMAPGMLSFGKDESDEKGGGSKNPLSFHPIAIIFGILAFISYLVEGGMSDWSAIFLNTEKDVPIERAVMGIGYAKCDSHDTGLINGHHIGVCRCAGRTSIDWLCIT